jgi:hypothetical protein
MATYKPKPIEEYTQEFQNIASNIFRQVPPRCGGEPEKGSYSFRMSVYSSETAAKIVIYEQRLGVEMRGPVPWRTDGVYVLVRTNGTFGDALWNDISWRSSRFAARVLREDDIAIAPNHEKRFAYFPVMAGESPSEIAAFIAFLMDGANALGQSRLAAV